MKKYAIRVGFVCCALSIGFIVGCNTTDSAQTAATRSASSPQAIRIAELQSDYEKMPAPAKETIAKGSIARGQSPEMVYIALGRPDLIVTSADGRVTTWTYAHYFPPTSETPVNNPTRKSAPKSLYQTQLSDPLQDNMQAWMHNVEKNYVPLNSDPQFQRGNLTNPRFYDPSINRVAKAPGQSWADYAKYVRDQEMAGPAAKMVDDQARIEYNERMMESRISDPLSVKLEVIFLGQQVSDAIANDSVSAFALQP